MRVMRRDTLGLTREDPPLGETRGDTLGDRCSGVVSIITSGATVWGTLAFSAAFTLRLGDLANFDNCAT